MIVLSIVSDKHFPESTFEGKDYRFDMDMDEDSTFEETLNTAFRQVGLVYEEYKDTNLSPLPNRFMFAVASQGASLFIKVEER